jgi:hypothetical protein
VITLSGFHCSTKWKLSNHRCTRLKIQGGSSNFPLFGQNLNGDTQFVFVCIFTKEFFRQFAKGVGYPISYPLYPVHIYVSNLGVFRACWCRLQRDILLLKTCKVFEGRIYLEKEWRLHGDIERRKNCTCPETFFKVRLGFVDPKHFLFRLPFVLIIFVVT